MSDGGYAEHLRLASRVTEPALRQAIEGLAVPAGSRGLDVGCGIGQHSVLLGEAVGMGGEVVGLDICARHLSAAWDLARQEGMSDRLKFIQGSLLDLPFEDGSFDWVWCADTLWPSVFADPVAGVRELARVVRAGGTVALAYWSSHSLLSGYPALEARLNSAFAATVPYLGEIAPHRHFLRASGWLKAAGLERMVARSYLAEMQAPLTPALREALAFCFSMLWGNLKAHVSKGDWGEYQRVTSEDSDQSVLNSPDYYGFLTYTIFRGHVRL